MWLYKNPMANEPLGFLSLKAIFGVGRNGVKFGFVGELSFETQTDFDVLFFPCRKKSTKRTPLKEGTHGSFLKKPSSLSARLFAKRKGFMRCQVRAAMYGLGVGRVPTPRVPFCRGDRKELSAVVLRVFYRARRKALPLFIPSPRSGGQPRCSALRRHLGSPSKDKGDSALARSAVWRIERAHQGK